MTTSHISCVICSGIVPPGGLASGPVAIIRVSSRIALIFIVGYKSALFVEGQITRKDQSNCRDVIGLNAEANRSANPRIAALNAGLR